MKIAFVDFQSSFYDRHWAYALIPIILDHGAGISWFNLVKPQIVASYAPDLVLYNTYQNNIHKAISFDSKLKALHRCKSMAGGPGVTFDQKAHFGTTIDAVCIGEGEIALNDYLSSGMKEGRNILLKEGSFPTLAPLIDLDKQPFPNREIVYKTDNVLRLSAFKSFISGRGCPYNCSYCFNHAYNKIFKECGNIVRKKSVDYMIEELLIIKRNHPLQLVSFQDDTFIIDKKWVFEFCKNYRNTIGIPFVCNIRPNLVTEEVVAALKEGGCSVISWSIESGNERIRNEVLCRNVSEEQIEKTIALMRKYKITHRTASVIGVPTETKKEVDETIEANIRASSAFSLANIFTPYPGLQLTKLAEEKGLLMHDKPLPKTFYEKSVLEFDAKYKKYLQKTSYLTTLFAWFHWTYRVKFVRSILYSIPAVLLHAWYEVTYLIACKRIYRIRTSPRLTIIMGLRYLRSVLK